MPKLRSPFLRNEMEWTSWQKLQIHFFVIVILKNFIFSISHVLSYNRISIKFHKYKQPLGDLLCIISIQCGLLLQGVTNEHQVFQAWQLSKMLKLAPFSHLKYSSTRIGLGSESLGN